MIGETGMHHADLLVYDAGTALGIYAAVVLLIPMLTFSLALLPILLLYTPFAFLLIGMVGVVVELTTERSPATLSFWSGWTLCPAVYLAVFFSQVDAAPGQHSRSPHHGRPPYGSSSRWRRTTSPSRTLPPSGSSRAWRAG
ncbi:hypothetical protein [Nonomuraea sp. NPDC049709]|uniref:hypothetical protein n=1 Tax=Nonomuraea sp. NPDC049709 TaxID=3154736 RepID=UPI0034434AC1